MRNNVFILLGLIPTVITFIYGGPLLGAVIGIIVLIIISLIFWIWKIYVNAIIKYLSNKLGQSPTKIKEDIAESENFKEAVKDEILKELGGGST